MTDKLQKKAELRIKIPQWIKLALDEHCDHFGVTIVSTITPLLVEYLGQATRVRDNSTNCINNIYSKKSGRDVKPSKKKRGSQIADDFSPPRDISEKYGLDHENAVDQFIDWAKSSAHVRVDWIACYRNACRNWIKKEESQTEQTRKYIDRKFEDEEF
tara:strand:+ start:570 stop:1043 length:474 start_codon:yes stop_codon:yes gene_type:complete